MSILAQIFKLRYRRACSLHRLHKPNRLRQVDALPISNRRSVRWHAVLSRPRTPDRDRQMSIVAQIFNLLYRRAFSLRSLHKPNRLRRVNALPISNRRSVRWHAVLSRPRTPNPDRQMSIVTQIFNLLYRTAFSLRSLHKPTRLRQVDALPISNRRYARWHAVLSRPRTPNRDRQMS